MKWYARSWRVLIELCRIEIDAFLCGLVMLVVLIELCRIEIPSCAASRCRTASVLIELCRIEIALS